LPGGVDAAELEQVSPAVRDAIRRCHAQRRWPLYLWGSPGTGKTCAAAVAYRLWKPSAAWMSLSEMCDTLKAFSTSPLQLVPSGDRSVELTLAGFWRRLGHLGLVVIDEIGTREATAHRYDAFRDLLQTRTGKPLIITGNLNPAESLVRIYDDRILSRITAGVIVEVKGPDRRMIGLEDRIHIAE
jgi:DNA replication protein DnaC